MKRKASIAALDDLYESILKDSLLSGLSREEKKEIDKEEDKDDKDDKDESETIEQEEISPKIIEFSVSRLGKYPTGSKKEPKIELKGGGEGPFSSKKKHRKRR